jgi:hypothetical protein
MYSNAPRHGFVHLRKLKLSYHRRSVGRSYSSIIAWRHCRRGSDVSRSFVAYKRSRGHVTWWPWKCVYGAIALPRLASFKLLNILDKVRLQLTILLSRKKSHVPNPCGHLHGVSVSSFPSSRLSIAFSQILAEIAFVSDKSSGLAGLRGGCKGTKS